MELFSYLDPTNQFFAKITKNDQFPKAGGVGIQTSICLIVVSTEAILGFYSHQKLGNAEFFPHFSKITEKIESLKCILSAKLNQYDQIKIDSLTIEN